MGKPKYWSGQGRTASNSKLKNNTNNNDFDHYNEASSTSAGCMCAVFQLFDFHPNLNHQPPQSSPVSLKPISQPLDHHIISKGTEAPRNSLESDEESPLPCTPKQKVQDGLHFPKGIVQIKTKLGSSPVNSNESSSPSTKTPTLVARLMGLDLLPQSNNSPSTTPNKANNYPLILQKPKNSGSRSLPETPRTSCEKKSNLENYHHRLSLQIPNFDRENASPSPSPSPGHYAKEIVKQIKETVSRKSGLNDITNYTRRDQDVINQTKPKRVLSSSSSASGCSSVSRETKNLSKASPKVKTKKVALKKEACVVSPRITKAAIEKPPKKCKKTPLSSELLSLNSIPTVVMKKGPPFSSPIKPSTTTMQSQCNQNQGAVETEDKESKRKLQTCNHQPHNIPIINHHQHVIQLKSPKHHITTAAADRHPITAEMEYVKQILLHRTNFTNSVHSLENYSAVSFSHKKLLSHLVEELLKPYVESRPYRKTASAAERWPEVVDQLCERVRAFPRAKCEVLEDIDGIIEKDLGILGIGFEEESEGIVKEIEELVFEELLNETVRFLFTKFNNGVV